MSRRRIAILGGGVASLTTAYELTRTPELAARHEVTVYQMGWRLGGKGASGRNLHDGKGKRIEEHGLHVWLGFYENAFSLMKSVYEERTVDDPDEALPTWRDAFKPQSFTPLCVQREDGSYERVNVKWPVNCDEPGDGQVGWTPWGLVTELVSALLDFVRQARELIDGAIAEAAAAAPSASLKKALDLGTSTRGTARERDPRTHAQLAAAIVEAKRLIAELRSLTPPDHGLLRLIWEAVEIGFALTLGILSPDYGILAFGDLERVDNRDLRAWLVENGAPADLVYSSTLLRALYDLAFAYEGGRLEKPNFAAGTAVRAVLRIVFTYKKAALFLMQAGMGETVVAPIYQVLAARGVRFEFFNKVTRLELSPDRSRIARVRIGIQAKTKNGAPYEPLIRVRHVWAWPSEPLWDKLADGARLQDAGVNFESHWCTHLEGERVLEEGTHFDDVVLGISLGAFKRLNDEPTMCDELHDASPRFAAMADSLGIVPTQAVELWTGPSLADLGWTDPKPAMDAAPEILDVWADMSQELPLEDWGPDGPKSIQYLCAIYPTDLYTRPSSDAQVPAEALAGVRRTAIDWLSKYTGLLWPLATAPGNKDALDYRVLFDRAGGEGEARLDAQWLRANVDPTECCVAAHKGTTKRRLGPDESGFANLVLAGDWTKNGVNTACVEAAVMSGMAASRALCGSPQTIVGENFFRNGNEAPMSALPEYVSGLGHGEQSIEPPGVTRGGHLYVFPLPARWDRVQETVDTLLNRPSGGAVTYHALPCVLLLFLDAPELTSTTETMGYIPDQECAFCVPLVRMTQEGPKTAFWMPYLFINSSLGMVTGREVWGFQKQIASLEFPAADAPRSRFVANATIFPTLSPRTLGQVRPLVTVEGPPLVRGDQLPWKHPEHLDEAIRGALEGGIGKALCAPLPIRGALDVASCFSLLDMNLVNLKQFRDAVDPTRACYQAIVEGPLRLDAMTFGGGGFLGAGYKLSITPCESHRIVEDLGLSGHEIDIHPLAFYANIGFSALAGRIVWKA
jgi:uncharacterized protein with NAD-binding domain and iron-sulfur cluster